MFIHSEKENIYTLDTKGELLITIMSSLAQEESRSISENVTWGQRKRFADGKVTMPYKQFLGYRKGADGQPEIEPKQAELVRRIYRMYMDGLSANTIATQLSAEGIPTPGNRKVWQNATIMSILKNEKYKGSALLQKRFTVDFLTKNMKENEGEVPQYYVEESHPAIIKPEEWDAVQVEIAARRTRNRPYRCTSPFSGKIICGDCGGIFGSKVWHSNDKYRRTVWQCNGKFTGENKCTTPHLYEEEIKALFIKVLEKYLSDRKELVRELRYLQENLCNTDFVDADMQSVEQEMEILSAAMRQCIMENASASVTEEEYRDKYAALSNRFEEQKAKYEKLQAEKQQAEDSRIIIGGLLFEITELTDLPITFKESLWNATVDHITVFNDDRVVFTIKDSKEITVKL